MKPTDITNSFEAYGGDAPELMPEDFFRARHCANMRDVSRETLAAAVREKQGKQRVSIMLDVAVIAFFKEKSGARGYQTLINQALHDAMRQEKVETTLRRVIREELRSASHG
ncbi:MAG: BrnA antitoxin family protein [Betaproteobacteria bacterium]|nr:BrnA antitoxin family protein [Betaproteobacteria bacterium]